MRVCKDGCDVTLSMFPGTICKNFKAFARLKLISSANIKEMEKNLPEFDLGFGYLPPPSPSLREKKKQTAKKDARSMKNTTRHNFSAELNNEKNLA